jgi:hypothetical protein
MASHAHGNPLPGIFECEYWLVPVIRRHKNTLHLRIVRNSPETDSIRSIAYFGQPPGLWFKGPDGSGCCAEEAVFVRTGDSAKRIGSVKLRQQNFPNRLLV